MDYYAVVFRTRTEQNWTVVTFLSSCYWILNNVSTLDAYCDNRHPLFHDYCCGRNYIEQNYSKISKAVLYIVINVIEYIASCSGGRPSSLYPFYSPSHNLLISRLCAMANLIYGCKSKHCACFSYLTLIAVGISPFRHPSRNRERDHRNPRSSRIVT